MIRIDEIWLATEPLDMRAGPDTGKRSLTYNLKIAKSAERLLGDGFLSRLNLVSLVVSNATMILVLAGFAILERPRD